ncbi:MAG: hypothetical protein WD738_21065 [Pirellulales bacterium]
MRRFRPRISLLSALVLMTIVGMALVIALLWREVGPLRAELKHLRDKFGALTIEDPTKCHAIRLDSHPSFTWNWRVWIPDGQVYELRYITEDIPRRGLPEGQPILTLHGPDEQWIGHRIRKDSDSAKRMSQLVTQQGTFMGSEQSWIGKNRTGEIDGVQTTTEVFAPGQTLELVRCRYSRMEDNSDYDKPGDGFMIWLVPIQKQPQN